MNQLEAIEARLKEIRDGRATFDGIRGAVVPPSDDPDLAALLAMANKARQVRALHLMGTGGDDWWKAIDGLCEATEPLLKEVES